MNIVPAHTIVRGMGNAWSVGSIIRTGRVVRLVGIEIVNDVAYGRLLLIGFLDFL